MSYLEYHFPNRVPSLSDSDRKVWASVGAQEVINHLKAEFAVQNETILTNQ